MPTLSLDEARRRAQAALERAGASPAMAAATAHALVLAEAQGLSSHGLARVAQYAEHLRNGRADGNAVARVVAGKAAVAVVDAGDGLAFPACELAVAEAIRRAGEFGVAFVGVRNSHHAGVLVDHLRPVAAAGMVGLGFANSPAAMPAAGGRHPVFGTNPVAAIFPRRNAPPLMIDLSLSEVARGKLLVAARESRPIPLGWALDAAGEPTTDPNAGLGGSMLPIGAATSHKGALLALVVELFATVLIGARFGFEASSFFVSEGNRPKIGQSFLVVDPRPVSGEYEFLDRLEVMLAEILSDPNTRMPGARRAARLEDAQTRGVEVPTEVLESL